MSLFKLIQLSPIRLFSSAEMFWPLIPSEIDRKLELSLFNSPNLGAVVDDTHKLHLPATLYLTDQAANGRSTQGATVSTYGESLVMWLSYLKRKKICLEQATEQDVQFFRNSLCHFPKKNGEPYADNTINLRVKTVLRFHYWAHQKKIFSGPLGEWVSMSSGVQPTNWTRRQRITPVIYRRIPRVLTAQELGCLFKLVGKPYSLMFKWAVVTGLRRFEICSLKKYHLPLSHQARSNLEETIVEFQLVRKGGRTWTVYSPASLLEETQWYQVAERPKPRSGSEDYVFLSQKGCPVDKGDLSRQFHSAMVTLGIKATLHCLRHTYAVIVLKILQSHADLGESINPLKTLQILMGHSSLESTEIYLQALDVHSDAVEEALNFLYGASK